MYDISGGNKSPRRRDLKFSYNQIKGNYNISISILKTIRGIRTSLQEFYKKKCFQRRGEG